MHAEEPMAVVLTLVRPGQKQFWHVNTRTHANTGNLQQEHAVPFQREPLAARKASAAPSFPAETRQEWGCLQHLMSLRDLIY